MELYNRIIAIIDANLIYCLVPIIITLIVAKFIFKNKFETKKALNFFRWVIIIYTLITWTIYLIAMTINTEGYTFTNRATGPYAIAYWVMLFGALVMPLSLFNRKLASKFWYLLLVAFAMKIGMYIERFIIIVTSIHRDYSPDMYSVNFMDSFAFGLTLIWLQGMVIAITTLVIFQLIKRHKL